MDLVYLMDCKGPHSALMLYGNSASHSAQSMCVCSVLYRSCAAVTGLLLIFYVLYVRIDLLT
jgi:hypothetical protein